MACGKCHAFIHEARDRGECRKLPPQVIGGVFFTPPKQSIIGGDAQPPQANFVTQSFYPKVSPDDAGCAGFRPRDPEVKAKLQP